ncbi:type I polyketide synthase [Streptomyces sp. NPDC045470]|uniref:type I polyketide synthase n=1 Tax=Streptomyces sp. NPDC045470 TaxID=3155469 RepID=UPI0033EE95E9
MDNQEKLFDYLKKTAAQLQETRKRLHRLEAAEQEPLAIVGMACRFPGGVGSPEEFWEFLASGGDGVDGFPTDRGWDLESVYDPDGEREGTSYVAQGAFLREAAEFDAEFFGISPREALAMDPQQRLLLETSWEALERAGIDPASLKESATGVFAGGFTSGYGLGISMSQDDSGAEGHVLTGNATSVLSGRVSYVLGLEGPAVTVDTACSSSLVALHLAAQSVRSGECSLALAGGATVMATPGTFIDFSRQQGLSADGRCRAFSEDADGTGWAEGAGMVVVERLSDARRNGHKVLALLRGSAVNQDGASNGLTAPNGPSQQRVIRAALVNARLAPGDVDVVEAHGTGTTLGDPIEAQALLATYGRDRGDGEPLWLGSVKSNIGHTQAAAGVAGVIKMVLALQHERLPQTLYAEVPSSHVDWSAGEVRLLTEPAPWPADGDRVRRAAVSAFGMSGTNAHLILEEAPAAQEAEAAEEPKEPETEPDGPAARVLSGEGAGAVRAWQVSGRSAAAPAAQADRLHGWLTARPELRPADVAWSLATVRTAFEHRAVIVGSDDRAALLTSLENLAAGTPNGSVVSGTARPGLRPVFVFPGQGSQWLGMGQELVRTSPVFAGRLAECAAALAPYVDWSLTDVLAGTGDAPALEAADVVQPALWAVMVSLADVWEAAGVAPDAVVGHSQGEIAAATVAGMLSLEDGARVVALRSRALKVLAGAGGMLSVSRPAAEVEERLARFGDRLSLAAVNGPSATVVSGEPKALEELKAEFEAEGARARMVAVDYASHSAQVDRLKEEITTVLAGITPRQGRVPMVSAMTGETLTGEELDAGYWYRSLRTTVHFERAVRSLAGQGQRVFIEVSPHPVLLSAMTDSLEEAAQEAGPGVVPAALCGTLRRDDGGAERLVTSLAEAFVNGAPVDWASVLPAGERVELPTYVFQHRRYWPKGPMVGLRQDGGDALALGLGAVGHPLLGAAVELAGGDGVVCLGRLSLRTHAWLADHAVGGVVLLPGTCFVELAVRAGDQVGCGLLEELTLHAPLVLPADGSGVQLQVAVAAPDTEGHRGVRVFSRPEDAADRQAWTLHAGGTLGPTAPPAPADRDFAVWPPQDAVPADVSDVYPVRLAEAYGPAFHGLRAAWRRGTEVFAEVVLPEEVAQQAGTFGLHPALLDAALHASFLSQPAAAQETGQVTMPFAWTDVALHAGGATVLRVRLRQDAQGGLSLAAADTTGAPVVTVGSLVRRPVSAEQLHAAQDELADSLFVQEWAELPGGDAPTGEWALLGADRYGLADGLETAGVKLRSFPGLPELVAAAQTGTGAPRTVVVCADVLSDVDILTGADALSDVDALPGDNVSAEDAEASADDQAPADDATSAGKEVPAAPGFPQPVGAARHLPGAAHRAGVAALHFVQQWLTEPALEDAQLVVVTRGADAVTDEDVVDPAAAVARGLLRSAQSENPDRLFLADLPAHADAPHEAALLPTALGSGEPEVAIRGQAQYGRRLTRPTGEVTRIQWPSGIQADPAARSLLVTGGTGTLGGLVARHLAATGRAGCVVLTSRSGPVATGAAAQAAELAQLGVQVRIVACDAADRDALAAVLEQIPAANPLGSVVHAAGVVDDGVIMSLTPERLSAVLRPKADAAWHLHELTAGLQLDRFVLFSSAAAVFGSAGQGSYVAANAFLDAVAAHRRATGLTGTSLQLGPWAHESGIGRNLDATSLARIDRGFVPLTADEGLVVLDTALTRDEAVLMPARPDTAALRAQTAAGGEVPPLWRALAGPSARRTVASGTATGSGAEAGEALRRRLASVGGTERDRLLLELVCAHAAAVLGHASPDAIDAGRAFTDVGFDSLTAVELRNRLKAQTGLRLPATLVFDHPTPAALAAMLRGELAGDLPATAAPTAPVAVGADEPIAIVGMACRFPGGATGPEQLWHLLDSGADAIGPFPRDRGWDLDRLQDPDAERTGVSYQQVGGFVPDAASFDAGFFGISPREALAMDPQQRLLLETSWEAFERAGIDPASVRGSQTGAFIGGYSSRYAHDASLEGTGVAEAHLATGNATSVLSGRLSYVFGLEGPAVTVDTACSSSLVALHMAAQALRAGECSLALAGGVTVTATPDVFVTFATAGGVSLDGRCRSFAASADGSGFAEGVGLLVVERLSDARRHGHKVLAVVRGSAVNQDGASNGLTAPNGPSQQRVIRAALANARLTPGDVDVVEAHGSATKLGDPIEAQALLATYGQDRPAERPLWLGSVKSNIGHTQAAAGVAGVIKTVLALQHERLPRTLHVDEPTPHVDWSAGEVRLLAESVPWPGGERVRRAGVSGFGMSGTNVHVILEEAPADPADTGETPEPAEAAPAVLAAGEASAWLVSGRSAEGLAAQAGRLGEWAAGRAALRPVDVAWSLAATRAVLEHRGVVVAGDRTGLLDGVRGLAAGELSPGVVSGVARATGRTVFVFAGQGAQWVGMGRELLASSPLFAARLDECAVALAPYVDWSLTDVLAGAEGAPALEAAEVVQPALWAVMVSLAAVWEAAGVVPDAVVGHSQGEIAAATVAGMLSLEDAARVVAVRSRALSSLDVAGAMVSVVMPAGAVRELVAGFDGRLSVAAVNGPASVVVSGEAEALAGFERELAARKVLRWRIPATDFVAHSAAVEPLAAQLEVELSGIAPQAGRIPLVSTVTGEWLAGQEVDAGYWFANLRQMVRFEDAVRTLLESGYGAFVEISPHPVLTAAVTETAQDTDAGTTPVLSIGTLSQTDAGAAGLLRALAHAHVAGLPVDWRKVLPAGEVVELPTYAFQHRRYWLEPSATATAAAAAVAAGGSSAAEARFWAAVEGGDRTGLARALAIENEHQLDGLLPALASWRRREQERSATESWRYRITWAPVADPVPARLAGRWLLLVPAQEADGEAARQCRAALTARGAETVPVQVPEGTVQRDAIAALLDRTQQDAEPASGVLSLLALDETPLPDHPVVTAGLAATLALVQALGDTGITAPLWVATRGAVATGPDEAPTSPLQAQVWGFGRIAGLEHPDRWGGLIDLPTVLDERTGWQLATALAGSVENQVALRPSGALGRRLAHAPQSPAAATSQSATGTALITGGTGALGGHVATWLAARDTERLVLTSRSGPAAAGAAAQAAALAARGTRVDVLACDTADRSQLGAVIGRIGTDGPRLTTVVHTAAVLDDGVVDALSPARLETALAAKAAGAAHLDELTADLDLDAFVLFSSVVATTGAPGQANYGAANAYLDALAQHRRSRGLPALAVAWGPWAVGVAQGSAAARQRLARNQWEEVMDPDLAVRALGEALDGGDTVLTVMNIDWSAILAQPQSSAGLLRAAVMRDLPEVHRLAALLAETPQAPAEPALAERLAGLGRPAQRRVLSDLVRAGAARVLGHTSPDAVQNRSAFSDLGFDSLTSVELRNDLSAATGLRLPATLLFDHPTPAALTGYLETELLGTGPQTPATPAALPATLVTDEPIAIIGMACRYAGGVAGPDDLWQLLTSAGDGISGFPDDRGWDLEALDGPSYVRHGGFIEDIGGFDAGFFGISPREALAMDPQQRLLLETSWEALERSGIAPTSLRSTATGLFIGGYASGYGYGADFEGAAHLITGTATSVLSGRVSYTLGLEGPAVTVDTACSSSLVALHMAAQALRSGECSMALAGGVTLMVTPEGFIGFSEQSGLAKDGRCKAFSDQADGMGMAEGAGVLVIERLSDARRNGHPVLAVLRGSATNQDGASNGLTAPNGPSQQRVIRAALANARLAPGDVDVVEAHGTGTKLGDPIEAQALLATYGQDRGEGDPLWLGSVKSNIGHTQAAAGVAGVIKMVLALQHGQLPRTLHVDELSSHVDWTAGEVKLLTEPVPWPSGGRVRRAGVSSFGLSGTNAHVILEEAPAPAVTQDGDSLVGAPEGTGAVSTVLVPGVAPAWLVSGRSAAGLAAQADRLRDWLTARPELEPADVAWSLAATRSVFEHRAVVVGTGRAELLGGVESVASGVPAGSVVSGVARSNARPVFAFAGQGSQWLGMGRELAGVSPVFAARLDECAAALAPYVDWSLTEVLAGVEGAPALEAADVVQPALWAVMVSLAAVWEAAGVVPEAVVGHSQGEIAAATVAGMLSLEDGARVVALRSRALKVLAGAGGMLSVSRPAPEVQERLVRFGERLSLAAVNGPSATVISGEPEALEELRAEFEAEGARARLVAVDYASHSAQVDRLEEEITSVLAGVSPRRGRVPMVSAMTGETLSGEELDAGYWYRSLRATVHYDRAVRVLAGRGHQLFVEVTPHPVLMGAMNDTLEEVAQETGPGTEPAAVCGTLRRDDGGAERLLTSLAEAFVNGAPVDWQVVLPEGKRVELPTYAFRHERFWPKASAVAFGGDAVSLGLGAVGHPLLGAAVELAGGAGVVCTGRLSVRTHPWLADHAVGGVVLLPGTGFVELAVCAGDQAGCGVLEELTLQAPLVLPEDGGAVQVQVVLAGADAEGRRAVEVFSRLDAAGQSQGWTQHAGGVLAPAGPAAAAEEDFAVWPPRDATTVDVSGLYQAAGANSYGYGPAFQGLRAVWRRGEEVFAEVALPEEVAEDAAAFGVHPALLDAVLHASALLGVEGEPGEIRLPFAWTGVELHASGASVLRARLRRDAQGTLTVSAADAAGQPVISVASLITRPVDTGQLRTADTGMADALFGVEWAAVTEAEAAVGEWALIGADRFDVAGQLAAAGTPVRCFPGLEELAAAAADREIDPAFVLVCAGGESQDANDPARAAARVTGEALVLVQEWLGEERLAESRLVVLTRGAVAVSAGEGVADLPAAALAGLVRSAQSENPDRLFLVDLPATNTAGETDVLPLAVATGEPELALRNGAVHARRLVRPSGGLPVPEGRWRLEPDAGGSLEGLSLLPSPEVDQPLTAGQVRVAVRATGLNFRDVLIALGMYPGGGVLGSEVAGTVLEAGPGADHLVPGDRVMGLCEGGFGPVVVTDARQLVRIPDDWSYAEAASVPSAFMTAWYALVELAGAKPGQRVLVHAATGGVGMAAVQIARYLGLEVFATASPGKWPVLAAMGLDGAHISSSRTAGFEADFLAATDGAGVDVVVNSLAGELTDASLRLLPRGGAFVEMGRTDVRDAQAVAAEQPGVTYRPFELGEAGPAALGTILERVVELLSVGELRRLPMRAWEVRRARDAFRFMQQARHTGKIVLTLPSNLAEPRSTEPSGVGSALITGGTGTLGGLVAGHLVVSGRAEHVVLTSRSGPGAAGVAVLAARVAHSGASVTVVACDAADRGELAAVLAAAPAQAPLRTVVHTAGVLDDGTVGSLTAQRVAGVLRPKADGAWNLHELTQGLDLDHFVLFSSAAATFSSPGQGNYVAANAFLDALAAKRRAAGLPATSLAWGMWADASALTVQLSESERARINRGGVMALSADEGLALLDLALARDEALLMPAKLDLAGMRAQSIGSTEVPPLFRALVSAGSGRRSAAGAGDAGADSLHQRLSGLSGQERTRLLTDLVRTHAAAVLGHASAEAVEPGRAFTDLGFDSLTAVELRNRLSTATGLRLPATLVFDYPNTLELASFLKEKLLHQIVEHGEPDAAEEKLRTALATVPLSRFREAGLMEALLRLAGVQDDALLAEEGEQGEDIDELDADSLIRLALGGEKE